MGVEKLGQLILIEFAVKFLIAYHLTRLKFGLLVLFYCNHTLLYGDKL